MDETPAPSGLPDDQDNEPTPMGVDEDEGKDSSGPDAMPGIQEDEPDSGG